MEDIDPRLVAIRDCLYRVAVKLAIVQNGRLLVTQEAAGWYSLPGGGLEVGEAIEAALERELQEEIGLPLNALQLDKRSAHITNTGILHGIPRLNIIYTARLVKDAQLTHKELGYRWLTSQQLRGSSYAFSLAIAAARDFLVALLEREA